MYLFLTEISIVFLFSIEEPSFVFQLEDSLQNCHRQVWLCHTPELHWRHKSQRKKRVLVRRLCIPDHNVSRTLVENRRVAHTPADHTDRMLLESTDPLKRQRAVPRTDPSLRTHCTKTHTNRTDPQRARFELEEEPLADNVERRRLAERKHRLTVVPRKLEQVHARKDLGQGDVELPRSLHNVSVDDVSVGIH